ncbi:MAG: sulfite exporter TauE/SafE family protein [Deltaproteobacteria bacterium]|nr:sulfite exporter TauE/SafE family protein [Deltaproteobacteria bacterium]MBW2634533.1 sulfite exporter TauE/SafE family protein [Deltaproteobacteria bacterium]
MRKLIFPIVLCFMMIAFAVPGFGASSATISGSEFKAGDMVTIEGMVEPGQDLYIAVAMQEMFAPKDTNGVHETKRLKKDAGKAKFDLDTKIPPLYYLLTTKPNAFGAEGKKRFGGPSVLMGKGQGIYSTTMYYLKKKFGDVDAGAKGMLGPIKSEAQWNFLRYANESSYGINTIVKEGNNVGKVTIFSRTVIADHGTTGKYWDKDTSINLDKATGKFTVSFKTYRHTPPGTDFDVYVNGDKSGTYKVLKNGFWLSKGFRYMNPLWIILGAILVGTYFSMIGAAGGMLMAAFQVLIVHTAGPVGINAANVLKPSNMGLTLFSPLGSFYRYAVVERRVAWPVGLSFGVGIFIGSLWLGKYVSAYLPMKAYKEWLAVLVVLMGIQTIRELMPKAMEKRKNIKAMVKKFNDAVAKAKTEGTSVEMGRIEPVKNGLTDYRFKFWGEEFTINPLLFAILGLAIGVVSRSFGIGGGFLLVPAMTTLGALPMYVAVPISLIGTSFSSIGAFIGYLMTGYLPDMWLMISIIIGGFVGGMLGSRAQKLFSEKTLKIVLAITLFFLFFRFFKIEIWI